MELKVGYKQTEIGVIPTDWEVKPLGDVFSLKSGFAFSSEYFGKKGPIVLTPGNFLLEGGLYFEDRNTKHYSGNHSPEMIFRCGDLVVVMTDLTPDCNLLGKPAFIESDEVILHNQRIGKVVLKNKSVNPQLLFYLLLSQKYLRRIKEQVTGSTVRHTSNKSIYRIDLAFPPPAEQSAIAQALGDVDALIAALDRLIAKKRDIKQATMQQLLTGKTRLPGFSGKRETKRLRDMADIIKGNTLSKSLLSESGINPCILYGELFTTYGRVITKTVSFTSSPEGIKSLSGDVLLPGSTTTTGADLATASALLLDGVALGGDINIVRQKGVGYDPAFLACYLTHVARNEIAELAQGSTIHHLYGKDLKGLSLSLPHHTEQSAIASVISDMDAELTALEARRDKTRALKHGMMQELLNGKTRLI